MNAERRQIPGVLPQAVGVDAGVAGFVDPRDQGRAPVPRAPIWRLVSTTPGEGGVPTPPWRHGVGDIGCGSLVVECQLPDDWQGHRTLIRHRSDDHRTHDFALMAGADGGVSLAQRQGDRLLQAGVKRPGGGLRGAVTLTYHWDDAARFWSLAVEDISSGEVTLTTGHDPQPFPVRDLAAMINHRATATDDVVIWAGLAEGRVPVGPMPGLAAETLILTPTGYVVARDLRPGDLVTTRDSGAQPILHAVCASMPGRGAYVPEVIRTNYLGAQRDLRVLPRQRIVVSGAEVEYLFGDDEVLVDARYFVHGRMAVLAPSGGLTQYRNLLFRHPELICANGCWVESLWLGRLALQPGLVAASCLADAGALLPVHPHTARRVLKDYEARTLAALRTQNGVHR